LVELARDLEVLAELGGLSIPEVETRIVQEHRPYVAHVGEVPVAVGWVATRSASIGALRLAFAVPPENRYLWDFVTVPAWRGQGIYPRMLQVVLAREEGDRFWIGHDAPNVASARGIQKAGFLRAGLLYWRRDGSLVLVPGTSLQRARAGAALLGVPLEGDGESSGV
jgi:GNAT superfamily N-acetyltransferase